MLQNGSILTHKQHLIAQELAKSRHNDVNKDINKVLDFIDNEAKCLSKRYKKSVGWFQHQLYQGGHITCQRRAVGVYNAAQQLMAS